MAKAKPSDPSALPPGEDPATLPPKEQALRRIEDDSWPEDPESWLRDRGWVKIPLEERTSPRKCWRDHKGGGASKKVRVGQKKIREGLWHPVEQVKVPALVWSYSTEEAIQIEREREKQGGK